MKNLLIFAVSVLFSSALWAGGLKVAGDGGGVSSWDDLEDIPAGFADGTDDTGASGSTGVDSSTSAVIIADSDGSADAADTISFQINDVEKVRIENGGSLVVIGSATFQDASFSVGGSTLVVTEGMVGIGVTPTTELALDGTFLLEDESKILFSTTPDNGYKLFLNNANDAATQGGIIGIESSGASYRYLDWLIASTIDYRFGPYYPESNFVFMAGDENLEGNIVASFDDSTFTVRKVFEVEDSTVIFNGVTYYFPLSDGSDNQVLTTDSAGTLTWETPSGSGDAVLADTQTWTGGNTFESWSVFNGSITATNASNAFGGDGSALTDLTVANIAAGSLPTDVIASSVAAGSVEDSAIVGVSGSKVGSGIAPGNLATGNLPVDVIASSVAVGSIEDSAIVGVSGSKVGSGVPAANIADGSLGSGVIASSIAVSAVEISGINASGTADENTFLRGDGSWSAVSGDGGVLAGDDVNWTGSHTWQSSATFVDNAFSVGGTTFVVTGGKVGISSAAPVTELGVEGTVTATAFVGDGSGLTGVSGSGDAVLADTQTWSGGNTYSSWSVFDGSATFGSEVSASSHVVVTASGTAPALSITANGTYGTTAGSSGGLFLDCTGGGAASGYCSQIYSNAGAQTALGGLLNIKADNTAFNEPLIYLVTDGTSGGAANIRMDGPAPQIEMVENDQSTPAGKYEMGVNGDIYYVAGRNSADSSFEIFWRAVRPGAAGGGYVANLATTPYRFYDGNSSNYVAIQASNTISSNVTWTLPAADGSDGQALTTDGSGMLTWETPAGSGDAVLSDTQTFSGANTFTSSITVNVPSDDGDDPVLSLTGDTAVDPVLYVTNSGTSRAASFTGATSGGVALVNINNSTADELALEAFGGVTVNGNLTTTGTLTANVIEVSGSGPSELVFGASTATIYTDDTVALVGLYASSVSVAGDLELTGHLIDQTTHSFTMTLSSGTGWDSLAIPFARAPHYTAITITEVYAESLPAGSSVQYRIEERAQGSVNSTGTDVFTVTESTANGTGVTETGFDNAGIAAKAALMFVTDTSAAAGDPDLVTVTVYYTKDD